jgi:hypothetical protein
LRSIAFSLTVGDGADMELVVDPPGTLFALPTTWLRSFAALLLLGVDDEPFLLPRSGVPRTPDLLSFSSVFSESSFLLLGVTTDSDAFDDADRLGVADSDVDVFSSMGFTAPGRPMPVITDADTLFFGVLLLARPVVALELDVLTGTEADDEGFVSLGKSSRPISCSVGNSTCMAAPNESKSSTS